MAIFGTQKKKEEATGEATSSQETAQSHTSRTSLDDVLRNPRITEKAARLSGSQAYTFDVDPRANKTQIKQAVEHVYNVTPIKVRVLPVPKERVFSRRTRTKGVKGGGKKAIVYLKKNDSIEFI